MTLEAYLIAAIAVVLTGISKSGFAGGLGILGVPLVALFMTPQDAAVLLLPILIAIDVLAVWRYRKAWKADLIIALLPGAAVGIVLGMFSFSALDPDLLRLAIGVMALVFVARYLWLRDSGVSATVKAGWIKVFLASALSGFASFIAHAGGPPIKGTLLSMNLEKTAFVGTNSLFFFIVNSTKAFGYVTLGLFSANGLVESLSLAPFLFVGVAIGFALHDRLSQGTFVKLAHALLGFAGFNLILIGSRSYFG